MGRPIAPHTAARVNEVSAAIRRRADRAAARTIADMPNGPEIARHLALMKALEGSTDPKDRERVALAALRAGALMEFEGRPNHPDLALLRAVAQDEKKTGDRDERFWELVGADPNELAPWRRRV